MGSGLSSTKQHGKFRAEFKSVNFTTGLAPVQDNAETVAEHWSSHDDISAPKGEVDIIFLHDIIQDCTRTWARNSRGENPIPSLRSIITTKRAHLYLYNYAISLNNKSDDLQWSHFVDALSSINLNELSTSMLTRISDQQQKTGIRPLLFVAHGFGGLIVEQAFVRLLSQETEVRFSAFLKVPHAAVLFGTPHFLAGLAEWAFMSARLMGIKTASSVQSQDWSQLDHKFEEIRTMQDGFKKLLKKSMNGSSSNGFSVTCCFSKLREPNSKLMISPEWAILSGCKSISLSSDHIHMTDFTSSDDMGAKRLSRVIQIYVERLSKAPPYDRGLESLVSENARPNSSRLLSSQLEASGRPSVVEEELDPKSTELSSSLLSQNQSVSGRTKHDSFRVQERYGWARSQLVSQLNRRVSITVDQKRFIPELVIDSLLTCDLIKSILREEDVFPENEQESVARHVHTHAPRFFLILIHIGASLKNLRYCMSGKFHDKNLIAPGFYDAPFWPNDGDEKEMFQHYRWMYFAVSFRASETGMRREYHDEQIIPYRSKMFIGRQPHRVLFMVKVEDSHQLIYKTKSEQNPPLTLSILDHNSRQEAFEKTKRSLDSASSLRHLNIVQLLTTYKHFGNWHFLFPFTDVNLDKYMATKEPLHTSAYISWKLNQMMGLAKAIREVQRRTADTLDAMRSSKILYPRHPRTEDRKILIRYHHDISPATILYFRELGADVDVTTPYPEYGTYQIMDIGPRFLPYHSFPDSLTTEVSPANHIDKGTDFVYVAPELGENGLELGYDRPGSYDTWSFGCIMMEILIWLIHGYHGLEKFRYVRSEDTQGPTEWPPDAYWVATKGQKDAHVRPAVKNNLEALKRTEIVKKLPFIMEVITLAEEMLEIDPLYRPTISQVIAKLEKATTTAAKEDLWL